MQKHTGQKVCTQTHIGAAHEYGAPKSMEAHLFAGSALVAKVAGVVVLVIGIGEIGIDWLAGPRG